MAAPDPDTSALLASAASGDAGARDRLLGRHRDRLRRMVAGVLGVTEGAVKMRLLRAVQRLHALVQGEGRP
jgi:DNA-directed RNA polymerase specialized sigma24 family protein